MQTIIGWPGGPIPPDANAFELAVFVAAGVSDDLRQCLKTGRPAIKAHPCVNRQDEIRHGMQLVQTADFNQAFMALIEADNRRFLYQSLPDLMSSGRYDHSGISLVFMDLDNFKQLVDAHGHLHGSQLIKEVVATIRQSLAPPAYAVAYAGDEFVVVLPDCGLDQAEAKALDIQQHIRDAVYLQQKGLQVQLKAGMGVAVYPWQARDAGELLALADHALFAMKARGKDGVRTYR